MRSSVQRLATTIVIGALIVACAPAASPDPVTTPPPSPTSLLPQATATPRPTDPASSASPSLSPPPASAILPVRGSAFESGHTVTMAPGPAGSLFVSIPRRGGSVLALLDTTGQPRPGWPIKVPDSTSCGLLLPVDDESVRAVCNLPDPAGESFGSTKAFAFDRHGRSLPGWPIALRDHGAEYYPAGRVIGDALTILVWGPTGRDTWLMTVAADGTVRNGATEPFEVCCNDTWAVGPDGVAYGTTHEFGGSPEAPKSSALVAFDSTGVRPGFPVAFEGTVSRPAFDADGRIHLSLNERIGGPARALTVDGDGRVVVDSERLDLWATDECSGIEGTCEIPAAPLVGPDGSTYVVGVVFGEFTRRAVAAVSPSGEAVAGWPYRSDAIQQAAGICQAYDICEGHDLALPTVGPDGVVYLLTAAADASDGGSIVAIGRGGREVDGWPVRLTRPGAAFWSVVVGSDGTAFALGIEPEAGDTASASILAIAPDSTVRYTTTIIEP